MFVLRIGRFKTATFAGSRRFGQTLTAVRLQIRERDRALAAGAATDAEERLYADDPDLFFGWSIRQGGDFDGDALPDLERLLLAVHYAAMRVRLAELALPELGAKAAARSAEFSWPQSATAMRSVLESVHDGRRVSGVI